MPQIKQILCPVDFSESSARAYDSAQSLARHYQAKLFLQHVVDFVLYPPMRITLTRSTSPNSSRPFATARESSCKISRSRTRGAACSLSASCTKGR